MNITATSIKLWSLLFLCSAVFSLGCDRTNLGSLPVHDIHVLPDASSQELGALLAQNPKATGTSIEDHQLDEIIRIGKKGLAWRALLPASTLARSTHVNNLGNPNKYNPSAIIVAFAKLKTEMPPEMLEVLASDSSTPATLNVAPEIVVGFLNRLDSIYAKALRWRLLKPAIPNYTANKKFDIRGYYFLRHRPQLEQDLNNWEALPETERGLLRLWLEMQCGNSILDPDICTKEFDLHHKNKTLWQYHRQYQATAELIYQNFFKIRKPRKEIRWKGANSLGASTLHVPFRTPEETSHALAFKNILEGGWSWKDWNVELAFDPSALITVLFKNGVVPNVNGLGGYLITMDSNQPLNSKQFSETLRHEFGHVLGFPDCYVEFYNPKEQSFINYFVDSSNLMCSLSGDFQEKHFEEIKRVYLKSH